MCTGPYLRGTQTWLLRIFIKYTKFNTLHELQDVNNARTHRGSVAKGETNYTLFNSVCICVCVSVRVPAVGKLLNKFSNSVFFFFLHFVVGWACSKASWEEGAILKAAHQLNRSWLADNTQRDTPTCTHKKNLRGTGLEYMSFCIVN